MNENNNKRIFPRIDAQCPVLYRFDQKRPWKVGRMLNFSANGIKMQCADDQQLPGTAIYIHIKPGSKRTIPEITAEGVIKRVDQTDNGEFILSCQLSSVSSK